MKRESGWYWVKVDDGGDNDGYIIGCYWNGAWELPGIGQIFHDESFLDIDENPITRKTNEPTTKRIDTTIS